MRPLFLLLLLPFFACQQPDTRTSIKAPDEVKQDTMPVAAVSHPFTTSTACLLAEIAYCPNPQPQLDKYLPGWKLVWHPIAVNGNHAFVATDGETYAVAIRGSLIEFSWDAFDNWIYQDLNISEQMDWPYGERGSCRISKGAYRGWDNLNRMTDTIAHHNLLAFLRANTNENTPILFTGHSLGGNLATVYASYAASELKKDGHTNPHINVITFAAPAAGNESFADDFNQRFPLSQRVENAGDIVAKFPCAAKVALLGQLYGGTPSAASITVGYKNMTVPLSTVFKTLSTAMTLLEFKNGISHFKQTNKEGTIITVKPSGNNLTNDVQSWFAEAGYQHGVAQYATALGVPVIDCTKP